jgi:hypothetical protein
MSCRDYLAPKEQAVIALSNALSILGTMTENVFWPRFEQGTTGLKVES